MLRSSSNDKVELTSSNDAQQVSKSSSSCSGRASGATEESPDATYQKMILRAPLVTRWATAMGSVTVLGRAATLLDGLVASVSTATGKSAARMPVSSNVSRR